MGLNVVANWACLRLSAACASSSVVDGEAAVAFAAAFAEQVARFFGSGGLGARSSARMLGVRGLAHRA